MTIQCAVPGWRACNWLMSRRQRRLPANLFLATAYIGVLGGLSFGALMGLAFGIGSTLGRYGQFSVGVFALVTSCLLGAVSGLVIGLFNGVVLTLLAHTPVLRSRSGVSRNRVTGAAVITTCFGSLALLYPLFHSSGVILVYPPVIAATLLAVPMSRKLGPF